MWASLGEFPSALSPSRSNSRVAAWGKKAVQTGKGTTFFQTVKMIIFLTHANPNSQNAEEMKSG